MARGLALVDDDKYALNTELPILFRIHKNLSVKFYDMGRCHK